MPSALNLYMALDMTNHTTCRDCHLKDHSESTERRQKIPGINIVHRGWQ